MAKAREIPDWETLLAHAAGLQTKVPGAILAGGTAAALHAGHRYSVDHDHVIEDLGGHYDEALAALEAIAGWRTRRRVRGKMALGDVNDATAMAEAAFADGLRQTLLYNLPLPAAACVAQEYELVRQSSGLAWDVRANNGPLRRGLAWRFAQAVNSHATKRRARTARETGGSMTSVTTRLACLAIASLLAAPLPAAEISLPRDTRVYLSTKEALLGKKGELEVGHLVRCEVWRDVMVNGQVVIAAGTPATARVDTLSFHKVAGIKGKMTVGALETESIDHRPVSLTGGYQKQGGSRIALSASLSALVAWPLIFITGKPAELPVGTVFDSYTLQSTAVEVAESPVTAAPPVITLTGATTGLSVELLYDKLQGQEKPRVFEFLIHAPAAAPTEFIIDTINGERTEPIVLTVLSSGKTDEELTVMAVTSISDLVKRFRKGINTIEVAYGSGAARVGTEVVVNIQI